MCSQSFSRCFRLANQACPPGLEADLWDGLTAPQSAKSESAIGSSLRYPTHGVGGAALRYEETHAGHDNIVVHASPIFSFSVHATMLFRGIFAHI
jgi:hypothetical protein